MLKYNWGANYIRLDSDVEVVPPAFTYFLCIRDMAKIIGWQDTDGRLFPFREYAKLQAMGEAPNNVVPKTEQRCIFTLDMYKGALSSWAHIGSGSYRGFYRLPQVSSQYWSQGGKFKPGELYLITLNNPSTISSCGFDLVMPGLYLAQAYRGEDGMKNWAVHQPGFRFKSTNEFSVKPRDLRIPDISADYWIALPKLMNSHSFR